MFTCMHCPSNTRVYRSIPSKRKIPSCNVLRAVSNHPEYMHRYAEPVSQAQICPHHFTLSRKGTSITSSPSRNRTAKSISESNHSKSSRVSSLKCNDQDASHSNPIISHASLHQSAGEESSDVPKINMFPFRISSYLPQELVKFYSCILLDQEKDSSLSREDSIPPPRTSFPRDPR